MERKVKLIDAVCGNDGRLTFSGHIRPEDVAAIEGKDLRLKASIWREKRSDAQNRYYWELLSELARVIGTSVPRMHNEMLRAMCLFEYDGDVIGTELLPDTIEAETKANADPVRHLLPSNQRVFIKGQGVYKIWYRLRGSSTYNSAEMAHLIDLLIDECKNCGIDPAPTEEVERFLNVNRSA